MSTSTESQLRFSCHTLDKATKAKVTLENYYNNLISQVAVPRYDFIWFDMLTLPLQHRERRDRLKRLEESLNENGLSETVRAEKRSQHATKETEFLRLKRSRLGVDDFEAIKVGLVIIIMIIITIINEITITPTCYCH